MKITALINIQKYPEDLPYNVQILFDGWYCGHGRFCRTLDEAKAYCEKEIVESYRVVPTA